LRSGRRRRHRTATLTHQAPRLRRASPAVTTLAWVTQAAQSLVQRTDRTARPPRRGRSAESGPRYLLPKVAGVKP
jgi:hypothetical protein